MAKKTAKEPASRPDEDNPEWTKEDFARARPASEVLPEFTSLSEMVWTGQVLKLND